MDRYTLLAAHALSSALFGLALIEGSGLGVAVGALAGAVAFLCLRHVHDTMTQTRDKRELEEDLNVLRAEAASIQGSLEETRKNVSLVTGALTRRADAHEKKVAIEFEAIERFLSNLPIKGSNVPKPTPAAAPSVARPLADPGMLDIIRRSLEENRVDLYLQPIVSLPQRKVRFYEALTRLRSADGGVVMPSQYIKVAAPAGLMSVIDNLLLFRCVQIMRRLSQRSRDIAVFCNISERTLADAESFPQLLEYLRQNRDLSSQIVFEFAQEAVLGVSRADAACFKALQELGFRLSIDQVVTLDCDFARLRQQGFHFVKVKANTLLSGMKKANAPVAAEDFKEHLSRAGLNLIVERVEDEKTVVQLLELNVDYGQGFLFGEPKPIRDVGEINDPRTKQLSALAAARTAPVLARRLAG